MIYYDVSLLSIVILHTIISKVYSSITKPETDHYIINTQFVLNIYFQTLFENTTNLIACYAITIFDHFPATDTKYNKHPRYTSNVLKYTS